MSTVTDPARAIATSKVAEPEPGRLVPLFEARLRYDRDVQPVVPLQGREGELVGSGSGVVSGERVKGTIRWSFFAGDCAYLATRAGVAPPPGQHLCTANPAGVIETDDGARIWLDARGFGLKGYDPGRAHLWRLTMALKLDSADPRYDWLGSTVGLLISDFDDRTGRALWRAQVVA